MNKQDLVKKIAEEAKLTNAQAKAAVDGIFASIKGAVAEGDKVQIIGFGTFEVKERAARTGRNPQSGAAIEIPASKAPVFKAGKAFKDAIK